MRQPKDSLTASCEHISLDYLIFLRLAAKKSPLSGQTLISAVLLFWWHAHASAECWLLHKREVSFEKLIRLMQHWGLTIARALLGKPEELLQQLRTIWKQILTNARKGHQKNRPTSWETLVDLWLNPKPSRA